MPLRRLLLLVGHASGVTTCSATNHTSLRQRRPGHALPCAGWLLRAASSKPGLPCAAQAPDLAGLHKVGASRATLAGVSEHHSVDLRVHRLPLRPFPRYSPARGLVSGFVVKWLPSEQTGLLP